MKLMKKKNLLSFFLIFTLCFGLLTPGFHSEAARATGTVKNRILNVRSSASTSSSIICKLSQGTKVSIISETTGDDGLKWYDVFFAYGGDAKEGFIRADLLNVSGSVSGSSGSSSNASSGGNASSASGQKYVKPAVAIIRTYASTSADIRSKLSAGTTATIVSEKTGNDGKKWYKISYQLYGTTMEGYIRSDLVTMGATANTNTSASSGSSSSENTSGGVAQVRSYASPYADVRATLENGTKVAIVKEKTGEDGQKWTKISFTQNGEKVQGYVPSSLLK